MDFNTASLRSRTLADVAEGEVVELTECVFDTLRELCRTLGLEPGEVVRGEARTAFTVVLRRADGRRLEVDRFYAAFVGTRTPSLRPVWSARDAAGAPNRLGSGPDAHPQRE